MNSCLERCSPGDVLVWRGDNHHVVTVIIENVVYAKCKRRGHTTSFYAADVLEGSISKIIKKPHEIL